MIRNAIFIVFVLAQAICSQNRFVLSPEYSVQGKLVGNDRIQFSVTLSIWGFVGINFSDHMAESDMVIVTLNKDNSFSVEDYWSYNHKAPVPDKDIPGARDDILSKSISTSNGVSTITFERLLVTNDSWNFSINLSTPLNITFAWRTVASLEFHGIDFKYAELDYDRSTKNLLFTEN